MLRFSSGSLTLRSAMRTESSVMSVAGLPVVCSICHSEPGAREAGVEESAFNLQHPLNAGTRSSLPLPGMTVRLLAARGRSDVSRLLDGGALRSAALVARRSRANRTIPADGAIRTEHRGHRAQLAVGIAHGERGRIGDVGANVGNHL